LEKLKNYSESPSSVVERDALRKMVRLRWGLALMDLNLVDDLLRRKNPRPLSKKKNTKMAPAPLLFPALPVGVLEKLIAEASAEITGKPQRNSLMKTASKLGPNTQTDRGTCPGVGL
jgi:hypothetical protein